MSGANDREDRRWMRRALRLARRGEGQTRPNPPVGAVVVRGGHVLGEGWHCRAGLPHAEVEALDACRGDLRDATLFVTLEPCCTHGRTPPCTDRIIRSGVPRVVVGCADPNPRHAGRGLALLRAAGIDVVEGVCREDAEALIAPFALRLRAGRPYVTLKLAMTLDGRIADRRGASCWITGPAARAAVQAMRRRADAVLVGAGTACADNPSLRCRLPGGGGRWRVVADAHGRTPPGAQLFTDGAAADTLMATTAACPTARSAAWEACGARVWRFRAASGRVPLRLLLRRLADEGILHVLCEGGGEMAGSLIREGLVDELRLFYAPAVLGDDRARPGFTGACFLLRNMPRFEIVSCRRVGGDVMVCAQPVRAERSGVPCLRG